MDLKSIYEVLPAIRLILSIDGVKILHSTTDSSLFDTLDNINDDALFITLEAENNVDALIEQLLSKIKSYKNIPNLIYIKGSVLIASGNTAWEASAIMKSFIDSFESEEIGFLVNTHELIESVNVINQRIAIVTGGAQGFGGGIVEQMFFDGANVVIADLNEEKGLEMANTLNSKGKDNKAIFVKTDVSNAVSVENLVQQTVFAFGGLDLFVSNAGVLRAGGLDEMDPETFEFMTKVNYNAYFLCAKYASKVMKIQSKYRNDYFTDIIQINSKSGLRGSNKNFAYAGGKFGGIGLTQSFAMELMPFQIKVNSICPGNFFEGPLWSDPEKGLFVQYLRAGKVPGAKTIDDVKHFYEAQVPAGRGCRVIDVVRAIYYCVAQEYETGQAIPVTGGQVMLN